MVFFPANHSLGFLRFPGCIIFLFNIQANGVFGTRLEQPPWGKNTESSPVRLLHQILIHEVLVSFSYIPMACKDDISTYIYCKRATECSYYGHNHIHEVTKCRTKWILWDLKFIKAWSILKQQITMRNFWSLYDKNWTLQISLMTSIPRKKQKAKWPHSFDISVGNRAKQYESPLRPLGSIAWFQHVLRIIMPTNVTFSMKYSTAPCFSGRDEEINVKIRGAN